MTPINKYGGLLKQRNLSALIKLLTFDFETLKHYPLRTSGSQPYVRECLDWPAISKGLHTDLSK